MMLFERNEYIDDFVILKFPKNKKSVQIVIYLLQPLFEYYFHKICHSILILLFYFPVSDFFRLSCL